MERRRCLNCGKWLHTRNWRLKQVKTVECSCGIRYATEMIRESHPERWEQVRLGRLFEIKEGNLYLQTGVGLNPKLEKLKCQPDL